MKTRDIRINDFLSADRDIEAHAIKPDRLRQLLTVLPSEVDDVIRDIGLCGRDIVWYIQ